MIHAINYWQLIIEIYEMRVHLFIYTILIYAIENSAKWFKLFRFDNFRDFIRSNCWFDCFAWNLLINVDEFVLFVFFFLFLFSFRFSFKQKWLSLICYLNKEIGIKIIDLFMCVFFFNISFCTVKIAKNYFVR